MKHLRILDFLRLRKNPELLHNLMMAIIRLCNNSN